MHIFTEIRSLVLQAIERLQAADKLPRELTMGPVTVEPPRDSSHGDMATNAALVLAKPAQMKPRDIAEMLAAELASDARIKSTEVAGPGFLNLRLSVSVWHDVIRAALSAGADFGRSGMGAGARVNVEYVSANPTGPLHVGHARGAVFGDALARLLAFAGYDVTREYYINDGGAQVDALARSVYLRYRQAYGQAVVFTDGTSPGDGNDDMIHAAIEGVAFKDVTYPGDYLVPVGQALKEKVGDAYIDQPETAWLQDVRQFATDAMMDLIRADLAALGVEMDVFFSEKSLYGTGRIEEALAALKQKGLIYQGVLAPPKGKLPEHWEPREQTLFRSTEHGDDVDRPVKKSDGSWTYFAPDIAYHFDKITRGFDALIDVFGTDHGGYVKRMKAAVSALSDGQVPLDIKLTQLVKLYKNGAPFKMSKRAGTFVTLRDVVDRVGPDVTRFVMLTRKNDAPLDFDFDKVLEQAKENPVFYVQYAHARIVSATRKATQAGMDVSDTTLGTTDMSGLTHPVELGVAQRLAEWPRMVELAARTHEPHRIVFYLYDLAGELHGLYNLGHDDPSLRFFQEGDETTTQVKIALARAVAVVISAGLGILGVRPAQEMR